MKMFPSDLWNIIPITFGMRLRWFAAQCTTSREPERFRRSQLEFTVRSGELQQKRSCSLAAPLMCAADAILLISDPHALPQLSPMIGGSVFSPFRIRPNRLFFFFLLTDPADVRRRTSARGSTSCRGKRNQKEAVGLCVCCHSTLTYVLCGSRYSCASVWSGFTPKQMCYSSSRDHFYGKEAKQCGSNTKSCE